LAAGSVKSVGLRAERAGANTSASVGDPTDDPAQQETGLARRDRLKPGDHGRCVHATRHPHPRRDDPGASPRWL